MKPSKTKLLTVLSVLVSSMASAQTSVQHEDREGSTLKEQTWGVTPQLGALAYTNNRGDTSTRGAVGLGFDWNAAPSAEFSRNSDLYYGLSTGVLYSHLGASDSNFFGADSTSTPNAGGNVVIIPANVKAGFHLTDSFRITGQVGGNVIYRSIASTMALGDNSNTGDSVWKIYPNAGMTLEYQVNKNVAVVAHPDLTIAPTNNLFVATLGATFIGY